MGVEQKVTCDLCGDVISEMGERRGCAKEYNVSVGKSLGEENLDIDMYKWVCEDCARRTYDKLMELDWEV